MNKSAIYHDILDWSLDKPKWQRTALKLIITKTITDEDINYLITSAKVEYDLHEVDKPDHHFHFLNASDLTFSSSQTTIRLNSISKVKNVNKLAPEQALIFSDKGLTIVYGDNGSGKTGYSRIIKDIVRCRSEDNPIHSDVLKEIPSKVASAEVNYSVDEETLPHLWIHGEPTLEVFNEISLFDNTCTNIYLDKSNVVAYVPKGLDVMPILAEVSTNVSILLKEELKKMEDEQTISERIPNEYEGTKVAIKLKNMNFKTNFDTISSFAVLSIQDKKRLKKLNDLLAQNPEMLVKKIKLQLDRLSEFLDIASLINQHFSPHYIDKLKETHQLSVAKRLAVEIAAKHYFDDEPVQNIGCETWRTLWDAAREFSTSDAYPDKSFPFTDDDSYCLLCNQPKSEDAKIRLKRFEKFVCDKTEAQADEAQKNLSKLLLELDVLKINKTYHKALLSELEIDDKPLAILIIQFLAGSLRSLRSIKKCIKKNDWTNLAINEMNNVNEISNAKFELNKKKVEAEKLKDDEERKKYKLERRQLHAKEWLGSLLDDVSKELVRLKKIDKYQKCIRSADTKSLSGILCKSEKLVILLFTLYTGYLDEYEDYPGAYRPAS